MLFQFGEHAAHEQGASRRVSLEIVGNHDGNAPPLFGTSHGRTHLFAEHIGSSSRSDSTIEPALTPVHQAKAVDPAVIPRRFDQPLPTSPLATPHARQRRMKGHLHLILQIQVSSRQECQQRRQVGGKLIPQISLDQIMHGERSDSTFGLAARARASGSACAFRHRGFSHSVDATQSVLLHPVEAA
jgi:hypothetical protein